LGIICGPGIICSPIWWSFADGDRLQSWDHLWRRTPSIKCPYKPISCRWNLWMPVTLFWTHAQSKKLRFSETALSLAVKEKLSRFACTFFGKIMAGTAHPLYVWLLCVPGVVVDISYWSAATAWKISREK